MSWLEMLGSAAAQMLAPSWPQQSNGGWPPHQWMIEAARIHQMDLNEAKHQTNAVSRLREEV